MSSTTSSVTPLIIQTSTSPTNRNQIIVRNPYESAIHQPSSRTIHHSHFKPPKSKYHYTIEQDGKSYRYCEWCRYWCTRKCPVFDFCDRVLACPFLFFILAGLFLLFLFIALLTLFGLHPEDINSARRYYGVISTLSIVNRTKFIFNLDSLCSRTSFATNCLNIVTSTSINNFATTVTINRTVITVNYSYMMLTTCLIIYCMRRRAFFFAV